MAAVDHTLRDVGGNPGRSGHTMSIAANRIVFEAREEVATFLGVRDSSRVIFTSGATESLNLAIKGLLKAGDHVVTSVLEHNSVMRPLHALAGAGVKVTSVECDREGFIDPDHVRKSLKRETRLVVLTHASNVIGAIEPIQEIGSIAREHHVPLLLDASQTAGSLPIGVEKLNVDMLAASGHKGLMGPQGTGILYVGKGVTLTPLKEGGTGGGASDDDQPDTLPDRYEAGTMNTPGIAGLGAAVRFIRGKGIDTIRQKEVLLLQRLIDGLSEIKGVVIYGTPLASKRASLVGFNIIDMDPAMVSFTLDENFGIMTRSGLHCAPDAHHFFGLHPYGCIRISPGYFNRDDEIDSVIGAIKEIAGA